MELSPKQQVTELIKKFNRILVVSHARPDGDALGSVLAMVLILEALGKDVYGVVRDDTPPGYEFLPGLDKLQKELSGSRDLIVSVDTSQVPVDKLKYNTREQKLNIIITPKQGSYEERDVSLTVGSYKYDLIIVLDAPDLDRLGKVYEDHPELFYETPVVNIDHHPSNDYFGAVNLVDITATSTSEILVGVIEALGDSLMTEDVATNLLTGLITDTGSFQNSNTTPKSLTVSAQLVAAGGRQQEIVQHIYKTKPLSTLKLWGRALSKLQFDPEARLVWSSITAKDFADTGGTATEAKGVIDALMSSAPDAEIILLLRENENGKVDGSVRTGKGIDALKVVGFWNGGGHTGAAGFDLPGPLAEAERKVVKQIRAWQIERLQDKGVLPKEPDPEKEVEKTPDPTRQPTPQTVEEALKIAQQAGTAKPETPQEKAKPARQDPVKSETVSSPEPDKAALTPVATPKPEVLPQPTTPKPPSDPEKPSGASEPTDARTADAPDTAGATEQAPAVEAPDTTTEVAPSKPAPATTPSDRQNPLTDEELDAYFRKTLGGKDDLIDQPVDTSPNPDDHD